MSTIRLPANEEISDELKPWRALVQGRKFIWVRSPTWDDVWTRQNHFATRLARLGAEVLYVENPCSWRSRLKQKKWPNLALPRAHVVRQIEPRLHVMRANLSFPGGTRSDANAKLNGKLIASQIERWSRSRSSSDCLAWCRL